MSILFNIMIAAGLNLSFIIMVYTVFFMPRKFFKQTGNSMKYKCLSCNTVHNYNNNDSLKIVTKPRNELKFRKGLVQGSHSVSFRYPCSVCGRKTMQAAVTKPYNDEQQKELNKKYIKSAILFFCSIVVSFIAIFLLENIK